MKIPFILIIFILISGCVTTPSRDRIAETLSKIEPLQAGALAKKIIFKDYTRKKMGFLMAFNKVGFDMFEIAKLMTEKDDRELFVKKFVHKNKHRILVSGDLNEISSLKHLDDFRPDIIKAIIEHIELNFKFYSKGL